MVNHAQEAVDKLIVNPFGRLTTTINKSKHNKLKDRLNRNPQSEAGSSDLVRIPINTVFKVCHQIIRGIRDKTNELINSLFPELPEILCVMEHHLKEHEFERILIEHYNLGSKFCRKNLKRGWSKYLCSRITKFW
jgi:hypothetical protein